MRKPRKIVLAGLIALGIVVCSQGQAESAFKVSAQLDAGPVTIVQDETPADTANGTPGTVSFNFSTGAGTITINTSVSNRLSGNTALSDLDLSVSGIVPSGHTLTVMATDTGFNLTPSPGNYAFNAIFTGSWATGAAAFSAWYNSSNAEFGTTTPLASGIGFGATASGSIPGATSPFSLTLKSFFTSTGTASISSDGRITLTTPAPAAALLAGVAVPVMGLGAWLRRRRNS